VAVFAVTLSAAVGSVPVFDSFRVLGALIALYRPFSGPTP
jgi:hypothetical protein